MSPHRQAKRDTYKYEFEVGGYVVAVGITEDLVRAERELRKQWPWGHIRKVGSLTTLQKAREWQRWVRCER